jgi:hypothetical protein
MVTAIRNRARTPSSTARCRCAADSARLRDRRSRDRRVAVSTVALQRLHAVPSRDPGFTCRRPSLAVFQAAAVVISAAPHGRACDSRHTGGRTGMREPLQGGQARGRGSARLAAEPVARGSDPAAVGCRHSAADCRVLLPCGSCGLPPVSTRRVRSGRLPPRGAREQTHERPAAGAEADA